MPHADARVADVGSGESSPSASASRPWRAAAWLVVALFVAVCGTYVDRATGLTDFIAFGAARHHLELDVVQQTPHAHALGGGYDGQFYAQLAIDPLARREDLARAMDQPMFRARRVLMSGLAWTLGLGRPAWVLQAYAVENVVVWLVFAWLLRRWIPLVDARRFVLWTGCVLSYGLLMAVRYALPDALAVLLISCGVAAAERERPVIAAIALGAAGLTRETALAAVSALFAPTAREGRGRWLIAAAAAGLPIALWTLYLAAEHPGWRVLAGAGDLGLPFAGIAASVRDLVRSGVTTQAIAGALALAAFALQAAVAVTSLATGADRSAWAWVAVTFAGAGVLAQSAVWTGPHDPFARITIPLAVGSNVLLARRIAPGWGLITLTNLGVLPGLAMFAGHWGGAG